MTTISALKTVNPNKTVFMTWETIGQGDVGTGVRMGNLADKTVQATGSFSGGASIPMEGSQDGVTWAPVSDALGVAIVFSAPGLEVILENPAFLRPGAVAGGDGSTDIDVIVSAAGLK